MAICSLFKHFKPMNLHCQIHNHWVTKGFIIYTQVLTYLLVQGDNVP